MAGAADDFDSAGFRAGIQFVMNMAASPIAADQATFYFPTGLVYNKPVDGSDVPFDPQATVTRTVQPPVRGVPCSIEYFDADGTETVFGNVSPARVAVTLLDEDYAKVQGCSSVVIGGDRFLYRRMDPPAGLFDVGLLVLHFTAEDKA